MNNGLYSSSDIVQHHTVESENENDNKNNVACLKRKIEKLEQELSFAKKQTVQEDVQSKLIQSTISQVAEIFQSKMQQKMKEVFQQSNQNLIEEVTSLKEKVSNLEDIISKYQCRVYKKVEDWLNSFN